MRKPMLVEPPSIARLNLHISKRSNKKDLDETKVNLTNKKIYLSSRIIQQINTEIEKVKESSKVIEITQAITAPSPSVEPPKSTTLISV